MILGHETPCKKQVPSTLIALKGKSMMFNFKKYYIARKMVIMLIGQNVKEKDFFEMCKWGIIPQNPAFPVQTLDFSTSSHFV